MFNKESIIRGVRSVAPLILGIIPFAMISGITAANTGLSLGMALLMSIGIFAGASQLAVLQLVSDNAHMLVIIYTALIINLRMMIYSLSIAPHLQGIKTSLKALLAYSMTDQSYAISTVHFLNNPEEDTKSFLLGASSTLWIVWQVNTIIGYLMGSIIPPELGLDFGIPLTFIAILFKGVVGWPGIIAIITSGVIAVAGANLPMNIGLVLAAIIGIAAGSISEIYLSRGRG
ncbi:AzlC family ABC transporter permease [Gudongella sp. SC589]|jgi:4-azaleucine resistance transporter AzlC|uniref:AzlC family ABC transporter permease n=1 Tax=Gudongella sp. SC589 TaxID=3385990 RepID=UPI0039046F2A